MAAALPFIAVAATALGTGVAVYGQMQQSSAASASANYQAEIAANNAKIAQAQAADATARGEIASQEAQAKANQLKGRQMAVLAQNGVDVNNGSAVDLTSDTAAAGRLDALTAKSNSVREADAYLNQSGNFSNQAALSSATASNISAAAPITAGATLLSGAGSVATQWYRFQNPLPARTGATPNGGLGGLY